jgi:hypothetical protein
MSETLIVPLRLLDDAHALIRNREAVHALALVYRNPQAPQPPPIPVRARRRGGRSLKLAGDGNHRLAAARLAGITDVLVRPKNGHFNKVLRLVGAFRCPTTPC